MSSMDSRKISIAIPTWERVKETIASFEQVHDDTRVSEIVIVDDASSLETYNELKALCDFFPKVKLYRNLTNQDCFRNKMTAVSFCSNDFVCLWDSDNVFGVDYLNKIFLEKWSEDLILTPDFAKPHFNFRAYSGIVVTKENVSEYIYKEMFETMLNANNFFVNKNEYMKVWDTITTDPVTSDSIMFCKNWLYVGNKIKVVNGLEYEHTVHEKSHYKTNVYRTPHGLHENILQQLREMK